MRLLLPLLLLSCVPPASFRDPGPTQRLYPVQWGDSLWSIALRYEPRGDYMALARANGLRNPDYILTGQKLLVPSADRSLPEVPRLSPAPALTSCALTPAPSRAVSLSGCTDAACVDTGRGGSVCACGGTNKLLVNRPGAAPELLFTAADDPWWYVGDDGSEPARSARNLLGVRAQLDADPALETLVAWRTHADPIGISEGFGLVVDDDGRPGAQFPADGFGVGSLVEAGGRCDLLATDWEMAEEPRSTSVGWYFGARRYRVAGGELVPVAGSPLVMRRLRESFTPAASTVGNVRAGAPTLDLAPNARGVYARSVEPALMALSVGSERHTLTSLKRAQGGLSLGLGGQSYPVGGSGEGSLQLGDAATGLLYPPDYRPADDASLRGKPVELRTYVNTWGGAWSVAWIGG